MRCKGCSLPGPSTAWHSTVSGPSRVRCRAVHPLPWLVPASGIVGAGHLEVLADHDRLLAVCRNAVSFAFSQEPSARTRAERPSSCPACGEVQVAAWVELQYLQPMRTAVPRAGSSASTACSTPRAARVAPAAAGPLRAVSAETQELDVTEASDNPDEGTKAWTHSRFPAAPGLDVPLGASVGATLVVAVADDGPGLDPETVASGRVFDPFSARRGTSTAPPTDLGMAVVKSVVAAMGGHVTVSSRLGVGTVVHARIPVRVRRKPRED
ncbi:hypothetical protein FNF28_07709 [Cafeteria roenbergensis]|uniref:histidine kinase n=1 Tax=Cafeteria roenbergensis TaxID=33653 RepID=A0A5A8BZM0_CAFRO|nr:hypothetical protein FNF28_07709 [Cafeteria roenbergensis]